MLTYGSAWGLPIVDPSIFLPKEAAESAMKGLGHSHTFKQYLQNCEPIDLNPLVVDLRTRHLLYWEPFSSTLREHNISILCS